MIPELSPAARLDLVEIHFYIWRKSASEAVADRWIDRLLEGAAAVAANPGMGRPRPELGAGLRSISVKRYLLIYAQRGSGVEIVRIIHGARDMERIFAQK